MSSPIQFFSEDTEFVLKSKTVIRRWITGVIRDNNRRPWYLNFIFCSDEYLLELNRTYLKHDTFTDILTFPYDDDPELVSGDIFISVERVHENAKKFGQNIEQEMCRVMVHGVLHLIGFDDHGKAKRMKMREMEEKYLISYLPTIEGEKVRK